jgi:hypothetical protein
MIMVFNKGKGMEMSGQCDIKLNCLLHEESETDEKLMHGSDHFCPQVFRLSVGCIDSAYIRKPDKVSSTMPQ